MIVAKFGGSSLADAEQFKKVRDIIQSDRSRRFVVPSAPGKRYAADTKVTDMLYSCYDTAVRGGDYVAEFSHIQNRFDGIIADLKLTLSLKREYERIIADFGAGKDGSRLQGSDYAASRGEYLNGIILAAYLGYNFIDPAECVFFTFDGVFDAELTNATLAAKLSQISSAVIPGFYGALPDGSVKTFSRGGSDFTGSIVAKAAAAELYENWTDVSGFLVADPRIVENPAVIDVVTYQELRELSYMGATVLHESAIFPVREVNIPIQIKNTNDPDAKGTLIVPTTKQINTASSIITGVAGRKHFSVITIEKDEMNGEVGFLRRVLTVLEAEKMNFEHVPSGIDTLCLIVNTDDIEKRPGIIDKIVNVTQANGIEVTDRIALVAIVGRGLRRRKGSAARIFAALAHANINISMIDQGSSELSIIVGIKEEDFEAAIRVIYDMFILSEKRD